MLLILDASIHSHFEWDAFRLMDFYLVFPHLLKKIKPLPTNLSSFRKEINRVSDSYVEIPNPKRTLFDLNSLQLMAANSLAAKGIVNIGFRKQNIIIKQKYDLGHRLTNEIRSDEIRNEEWFKVIVNEIPRLDVRGKNGLKKRSSLMEYRYDSMEKEQ